MVEILKVVLQFILLHPKLKKYFLSNLCTLIRTMQHTQKKVMQKE